MRCTYSAGVLVLAALLSTGARCSSDGPPANDEDLVRLENEILEMIGHAEASDVSFCSTIAFGSKPCGGPWRYLVYSAEVTDPDALEAKVAEYNRLQDRINREKGLVSDCSVPAQPTVELRDNACVAAAGN